MGILDILALADWLTPTVTVARQVKDKTLTHAPYGGSKRDIELARGVLAEHGVSHKYYWLTSTLTIPPESMTEADQLLRQCGFTIDNRGRIKYTRA